MTAVTFGDLLDPGREHLARAAGLPDDVLRGESVHAAAAAARRLALTLARYLADIAPYGMAETVANRSLGPQVRAAVDGREALRIAAAAFRSAARADVPAGRSPDTVVAHLTAARIPLAAGRDLLRTHFATRTDGILVHRSDWSAVVISGPVTRALAAEVAFWSRQLAVLITRLSQAAETSTAVPPTACPALASGGQWLLTATAALTAGQRKAPATTEDTALLNAIPARVILPQRPPGDGESGGELAAEVARSAARLRVIVWGTAHQAAWSGAMTAESWRWTATGAAVTCHLSQLLLESLASRPGLFTGMPQVALQLRAAGESAGRACAAWRDAVAAWDVITTETQGLTAPDLPDLGDLIVRLGRLAFTDPAWTPARVRYSPLRNPASLAPGPAQFNEVVSAVHHAVSAVVSVAATDQQAVDIAARASRLHVPTRTLPAEYDVPRKFGNAVPATAAALIDAYQAAGAASELAVADLDRLATTVGAASRILGFARAATRLGPDTTMALTAAPRATRRPDVDLARMKDRPPVPAVTAPDGPGQAVMVPPGPAELAVRGHGPPDLGLLMHARVIDKAIRKLVAEVNGNADGLGSVRRTAGGGQPQQSARSPARVAGEGFPAGPVTAVSGRGLDRPRSHGPQRVPRVDVPGRIPPGDRRQPP
jgi:hypothetical protein